MVIQWLYKRQYLNGNNQGQITKARLYPCAQTIQAQPCTALHSHTQPRIAMHSLTQPCTALNPKLPIISNAFACDYHFGMWFFALLIFPLKVTNSDHHGNLDDSFTWDFTPKSLPIKSWSLLIPQKYYQSPQKSYKSFPKAYKSPTFITNHPNFITNHSHSLPITPFLLPITPFLLPITPQWITNPPIS